MIAPKRAPHHRTSQNLLCTRAASSRSSVQRLHQPAYINDPPPGAYSRVNAETRQRRDRAFGIKRCPSRLAAAISNPRPLYLEYDHTIDPSTQAVPGTESDSQC